MKTTSTGFAAPAAIALMFAAALPFPAAARYADDFDGHYDDLLCAEDDCDCLEPDSNRFKVVSPCNLPNTGDTVVFTGAYDQVQAFFENAAGLLPALQKSDRLVRRNAGANHHTHAFAECRNAEMIQFAFAHDIHLFLSCQYI